MGVFLNVVGARPNFMKVAPVHRAMQAAGLDALLVHTGQHYDAAMSEVFFRQLGMPEPAYNLEVGSGSHAVQTARIMERFETLVLEHQPRGVLVAGDVNSTIACALVATKLGVPVIHLEAGLRSGDRSMPEEINRILTDQISDLLLTPSPDADANLAREGIPAHRIAWVGNAMIDSLETHLAGARALQAPAAYGLEAGGYGLITLHRPSNVDDPADLRVLLETFERVAERVPLLFPVHPRTLRQLDDLGWRAREPKALQLVPPCGYLEFLGLQAAARLVLTDSGGIQEETTALGVPCLTLRENTERPITITEGTNRLVGRDPTRILAAVAETLQAPLAAHRRPARWDGRTGPRVVDALRQTLGL